MYAQINFMKPQIENGHFVTCVGTFIEINKSPFLATNTHHKTVCEGKNPSQRSKTVVCASVKQSFVQINHSPRLTNTYDITHIVAPSNLPRAL